MLLLPCKVVGDTAGQLIPLVPFRSVDMDQKKAN